MIIKAEDLKKECAIKQEEFIKKEVKQLYALLEMFIEHVKNRENYNTNVVWHVNKVQIKNNTFTKYIYHFNDRSIQIFQQEMKELGYDVGVFINKEFDYSDERKHLVFTLRVN